MLLTSTKTPIVKPTSVDWFSPLGEYMFEDNVLDTSGNGRDATAFNSPSYGVGHVGSKCIILDGINQYVELQALAAWEELNGVNFSCGIWCKTTDVSIANSIIGNYATLIAASPVPNQYWNLTGPDTAGDTWCDSRVDNGARRFTTGKYLTASDGAWHFHIYEKDGLTVNYYVDNNFIDSDSITPDGDTANNQAVRIGVWFGRFLAGSFDALRLWDKILTAPQKTELFNET